jgi:hypothetical protein
MDHLRPPPGKETVEPSRRYRAPGPSIPGHPRCSRATGHRDFFQGRIQGPLCGSVAWSWSSIVPEVCTEMCRKLGCKGWTGLTQAQSPLSWPGFPSKLTSLLYFSLAECRARTPEPVPGWPCGLRQPPRSVGQQVSHTGLQLQHPLCG